MKVYSLHYKTNAAVTDYYINIVEESLQRIGVEVIAIYDIYSVKNVSLKNFFFVSDIISFLKLWVKGYRNIILWIQGIVPEESFVYHESTFRYYVLCILERFALKRADMLLLVSKAMKNHFENKYGMKVKNYFIMPCFNEELEVDLFNNHDYTSNEFVYVGGLSKWQCIDETLDLYKYIENKYENTSLKILTSDKQLAEKLVTDKKIKNYVIDSVPKDNVKNELKKSKFGFCLREDCPINNVATPTKLSSYICSGVMPIYTSSIYDFFQQAKNNKYCLQADSEFFEKNLEKILNTSIDGRDIYCLYKKDFGEYYSRERYIDRLENILKNILDCQK